MRKHCGNCANYKKETNQFSEECRKCVSARLENGETTDPSHWRALPQTNADRIRDMSDEELADFFFESPQIEFEVCEHCQYFGGHTSDTPCKHDMGRCFVPSKNEAFKKWLKQPAK